MSWGWRPRSDLPSTSSPPANCPHSNKQRSWCHYSHCDCLFQANLIAFSALTLLAGHREEHPACKNLERCWRGYLYGSRCKWYACGAADATDSRSSLASLKSRMALPFWCWLTQVVLEKAVKLGVCLFQVNLGYWFPHNPLAPPVPQENFCYIYSLFRKYAANIDRRDSKKVFKK